MTELVKVQNTSGSLASINELADKAKQFMLDSESTNTKRAHKSDWLQFVTWCSSQGLQSLPASPEVIALYVTAMAEVHKPSTIMRRLASISKAHQAAGIDSPTYSQIVKRTMRGIRSNLGTAANKKRPFRENLLRESLQVLPDNLQGIRDKAILLLGYAGAFRRSELAALNVDDLEFLTEGVKILVRHSKTDQEGRGQVKAIRYGVNGTCPVRALQRWLEASGITEGALFRPINRHGKIQNTRLAGQGIAIVVKRIAEKLGLDEEEFGAHSLRAGLVTDGYANDAKEVEIMDMTGHKSREILAGYRREADLFKHNVLNYIKL